eukprot:11177945-Lingulodinium_polyedra.AAC.1
MDLRTRSPSRAAAAAAAEAAAARAPPRQCPPRTEASRRPPCGPPRPAGAYIVYPLGILHAVGNFKFAMGRGEGYT